MKLRREIGGTLKQHWPREDFSLHSAFFAPVPSLLSFLLSSLPPPFSLLLLCFTSFFPLPPLPLLHLPSSFLLLFFFSFFPFPCCFFLLLSSFSSLSPSLPPFLFLSPNWLFYYITAEGNKLLVTETFKWESFLRM